MKDDWIRDLLLEHYLGRYIYKEILKEYTQEYEDDSLRHRNGSEAETDIPSSDEGSDNR